MASLAQVPTSNSGESFIKGHPKYRQALQKKFPSLVCAGESDDTTSTASGQTNVTAAEEKPAA